jgi:hypothetical protein
VPFPSGFIAFEEGAEVVYVEGTPSAGGAPDVDVRVEGFVTPAFENGVPILEGLQQMHEAVLTAIREIEALI